jgi:hypothetical protein
MNVQIASTPAQPTATMPYVGWRRRLGCRWAAVAFGDSKRQALFELYHVLRREGGGGWGIVLPRGEPPEGREETDAFTFGTGAGGRPSGGRRWPAGADRASFSASGCQGNGLRTVGNALLNCSYACAVR